MNFSLPYNYPVPCTQYMVSKFPRFWRIDPEVWFVQVEAFFTINGIKNESDKFTVLVANVDYSILPHIADIILSSVHHPQEIHTMYRAVKQRILQVFAKDEEARVREIIRDYQHVVDRPSQLLNAMLMSSSRRTDDKFIKTIFIKRLKQMAQIRWVMNESQTMQEIGQIADRNAASHYPFMEGFWYPLAPSNIDNRAQLQSKEIMSSMFRCA